MATWFQREVSPNTRDDDSICKWGWSPLDLVSRQMYSTVARVGHSMDGLFFRAHRCRDPLFTAKLFTRPIFRPEGSCRHKWSDLPCAWLHYQSSSPVHRRANIWTRLPPVSNGLTQRIHLVDGWSCYLISFIISTILLSKMDPLLPNWLEVNVLKG